MLYSVLRLRGQRMVVALVERQQLGRQAPDLIKQLQDRFHVPAMLVASDSSWRTARAYAEFDTQRHLFELIGIAEHVQWSELPC